MELRQLRYFVAVAEEGNISRAAKKIFLTQPALSRQIKALEDEIGHALLERQAHSIRLTASGEALLKEARELLARADQMLDRVRQVGQGICLRVGYAPSLADGILSIAVENFTQVHPNARVQLLDLSSAEMLAGMENDTLDLALTVGPQRPTRGLTWVTLLKSGWKLAIPKNHAMARKSHITPQEVAQEPLLVYCQRDYPEYLDNINQWLRNHHLRPKIGGEYDGVDSLMSAISSGLGIGLVSNRSTHRIPERVRLKDLPDSPEPVCIAVGHRTNRSDDKPLAVFVEELKKSASRLG